MIAELVTLLDLTGDKVYVNRWALVFAALLIAVLVWHKVWRR